VSNVDAERFASLTHAYGPATDTPGHLAALRAADDNAQAAAMEHLWSAVIHQGTPWTATPLAATTVAELLTDAPPASPALRANLLDFLAAVAEAGRYGDLSHAEILLRAYPPGRDVDAEADAMVAAGDEELLWEDDVLGGALHARTVLGCFDVVPNLLAAATAGLSDHDPSVRSAAANAVAQCCQTLDDQPGPLAERLALLAASAEPDERATHLMAMGRLGLAPREYLLDPHPGVRACAALAPALAHDNVATAEILAALVDPVASEEWFTNRPPQFDGHIRFALVAAAIDRVSDFEQLLPAATAIARIAHKFTVNSDWGPLLRAAFPHGAPTNGLSDPQRRYLAALVDNPDLWDPRFGNASVVFGQLGLPYDRDACHALASE
jgi:hypothetical protein